MLSVESWCEVKWWKHLLRHSCVSLCCKARCLYILRRCNAICGDAAADYGNWWWFSTHQEMMDMRVMTWHIQCFSKISVEKAENVLGMIMIRNFFGHGHDHDQLKTEINVTKSCQIEDLKNIIFPPDILKIPRVCKNINYGNKPSTHASQYARSSESAMFS